jgi:hypothetical protein
MKRREKRHPNTSKIDYYNYGDEVRKLRGVGICISTHSQKREKSTENRVEVY